MFTSHHITEFLVADRQQSLRAEARQHHLGRVARVARRRRQAPARSAQPRSLPSPPEVRPASKPRRDSARPAAAALAAWKRDQRAA